MEMEGPKIKATAEKIVKATAGLPSARAIRELMAEYVSQQSQERRLIILEDVYSCLAQDLGGPASSVADEEKEVPYTCVSWDASLPEETTGRLGTRHRDAACSFCEVLHEFYPGGRARGDRQTLISEHLERRHGVRLDSKKITR